MSEAGLCKENSQANDLKIIKICSHGQQDYGTGKGMGQVNDSFSKYLQFYRQPVTNAAQSV